MNYSDGTRVMLGDLVSVPIAEGLNAIGRVVMLGDTYEHLPMEEAFLSFVLRDIIFRATAVAVEWVDSNPFAHNDPTLALVGNYMTTDIDEDVCRVTPNPSFERTPDGAAQVKR